VIVQMIDKKLIIGFRGTSSFQDFLVDLNLIGKINECEGQFHSEIYRRSKKLPIKHFIERLININKKYEIIFTGHSLRAAIASLVTVQVLTHRAVLKKDIRIIFTFMQIKMILFRNFFQFFRTKFILHLKFQMNWTEIPIRRNILNNLLAY
jgi:hypothetical protein